MKESDAGMLAERRDVFESRQCFVWPLGGGQTSLSQTSLGREKKSLWVSGDASGRCWPLMRGVRRRRMGMDMLI